MKLKVAERLTIYGHENMHAEMWRKREKACTDAFFLSQIES